MRLAFVTGAASGIGRAVAERLGREGLEVVIADVDEPGAGGVAEAVAAAGGVARAVRCDVADIDSVRSAVSGLERIDVLVNNAGFDEPGFFLETEPSLWERLIAVNLTGVLNCTYVTAPLLARSPAGRIVNVASDAGRAGALGEAVYSSAKGGVIAFSKSMARELAREGVTVNAVCPGPVETPMTERILRSDIGKMMMDRMIRATPLRRAATAGEVAAAVSYLASEEAGFVTGQVLSVSGGLTMSG